MHGPGRRVQHGINEGRNEERAHRNHEGRQGIDAKTMNADRHHLQTEEADRHDGEESRPAEIGEMFRRQEREIAEQRGNRPGDREIVLRLMEQESTILEDQHLVVVVDAINLQQIGRERDEERRGKYRDRPQRNAPRQGASQTKRHGTLHLAGALLSSGGLRQASTNGPTSREIVLML